jgi:hypothetical protein
MEKTLKQLHSLDAVKSIDRHGDKVIEINLYSREIKKNQLYEIRADLRKTSRKIKNVLDENTESWNWNQKPEKKYRQEGPETGVNDRKPLGHDRNSYTVTVEDL